MAKEALAEAGFESNGYTLINGSVILVDLAKGEEYYDAKFGIKFETLIYKLKEKGVKHDKQKKSPIQFKYIGRNSRGEILAGIGGDALRQQQRGAGFRNVFAWAEKRTCRSIGENDVFE